MQKKEVSVTDAIVKMCYLQSVRFIFFIYESVTHNVLVFGWLCDLNHYPNTNMETQSMCVVVSLQELK